MTELTRRELLAGAGVATGALVLGRPDRIEAGRTEAEYTAGNPLIGSESLKEGLARLSGERVNDTLLVEASEQHKLWIERFRDGRAEHNEESIAAALRLPVDELTEPIRVLNDLGFLEVVGATYKVPMLYRAGLNISQGKAFAPQEQALDDDE